MNLLSPSRFGFEHALRTMTALVAFSRAWQLLTLDANLPTLVHYRPCVELILGSMTDPQWSTYLHADSTMAAIVFLRIILLVFCMLGGLASLLLLKWLRKACWVLMLPAVAILLIELGSTIDKAFKWAQLFEHASQAGVFVMLWMQVRQRPQKHIVLLGKIAIAATFIAHGLFAASYYGYPPASFISMMIIGFNLNEPQAVQWLLVAGIVDFIVAVGIFWRPTRRASYVYMIAWGFLTAFARLYTNFTGWAFMGAFMGRWVWEFLVRTPHWGLPWVLLKKDR